MTNARIWMGWLLAAGLLLGGCRAAPEGQPQAGDPGLKLPVQNIPLKGVSLSPRSFSEEDFREFLDRAAETQDALLWAGDWIEIEPGGAGEADIQLAAQAGLAPIIEVGHYLQESGELIRPFTPETQTRYRESALAFVESHHPPYFGMGVEINIFARKNPEAFQEFVPFYNELYEAIKEVSPQTQVFTVYQLETMKGLALWEIEGGDPQWDLLELFKSDLAAFTSYPGLFYRDPADLPADHYREIARRTDLPIAITELGWHSAPAPPGWESSPAEQAEFLERFQELTDGLDLQVEVWTFLYDNQAIQPFNSMGLIGADGTPKPAWEVWTR